VETFRKEPARPEPRAHAERAEPLSLHVQEHDSHRFRCPFCHERIAPERDALLVCATCRARHHRACWREGTKCAACGSGRYQDRAGERRRRAATAILLFVCLMIAPAFFVFLSSRYLPGRPVSTSEKTSVLPRAGEWTLQKNTTRTGGAESTTFTSYTYTWVSAVENGRVTTRTQILLRPAGPAISPAQESVVEPGASWEIPVRDGTALETIDVGRSPLECRRSEVTTRTDRGAWTTICWFSREIPLTGLARFVVKNEAGEVTAEGEVVAFGHEGGGERPIWPR
jgi:hypothetical protein